MHALFVTHYYPPEELSMAILVRELAEGAVKRGHRATVLTGYPNWPTGRCFAGYSTTRWGDEEIAGVRVLRMPYLASPNGPLWRRYLDFKSFQWMAGWSGGRFERPDVVYSNAPPNEDGIAAARLAAKHRRPCVLNVQDVQPDSAIELGHVTNPLLVAALQRQERRMYAGATRVVAIGEGFRQRILAKGVDEARVSVIPNWIDTNAISPTSRLNPLRKQWQIPENAFVALYAGTLGRVHGTTRLLDVAERLRAIPDFRLLLVGQGYDFQFIRQAVGERNLDNVVVRDFVPRDRLNELQGLSDVSLVTLRRGCGATSVPSKALAYLAAGRPVLGWMDQDCDTARLIREAKCGTVVDPDDVSGLARELERMYENPGLRSELGANGREYVKRNLDVNVVVKLWFDELESAASKGVR